MIDDMCEYTEIQLLGETCPFCGTKDHFYVFMPSTDKLVKTSNGFEFVDVVPKEAKDYISAIELWSCCMKARVVGKSIMKKEIWPPHNPKTKPKPVAPTNQNLIKAIETITEAVRKNRNRRR